MLNTFLAHLPDLSTGLVVLLAVEGVVVTLFPPRRFQKLWATFIILFGIASVYYIQKAQQDTRKELFDKLIGGDDYCYLFVINPNGLSEAPVSILHPGHYPLHDVYVVITKIPGKDASNEEILQAIFHPVWTHFFPVLYPRVSPLGFTLPPGSYKVDIDAVNGGVVERIEIKEVNGKAEPTFTVYRKSNSEQLVPGP